jgi:hypothetical protein
VPEPALVRVELVARNAAWPNAAGDRLQLAGADERADVVLGALELGRELLDGQRGGPFDERSIAVRG